MKKSSIDTRTITEVLNTLITERTDAGDTVHFTFRYRQPSKPQVWFEFISFDKGKTEEELTDFLPDSPYVVAIDHTTGKPYSGEVPSGDWRSFLERLGTDFRSMIESGGRGFTYEEVTSAVQS